jgi:hypothetical protein
LARLPIVEENRMSHRSLSPSRCIAAAAGLVCATAFAGGRGDDHGNVQARLKGFQEVPAVSTAAAGRFKARIDGASMTLHYELSYDGLEGDVRQAHIHFGQRGVSGGIMIWLCQTATNPSPVVTTPTCPQSGAVAGVVGAADVVGPAGQGVAASEWAEALAAIRAGVAYANVHSSKFPTGEIRGQLRDD